MSKAAGGPTPASTLSEFIFCPRKYYYGRVLGLDERNILVEKGRVEHSSVDDPRRAGRRRREDGHIKVRGLQVDSATHGVVAKIDVAEEAPDGTVIPVEHKRGRGRIPAWDEDRVQVGLQLLLLKEAGYAVTHGIVFYRGSRQRVEVPWSSELEADVVSAIGRARALEQPGAEIPPILEDRRACHNCRFLGVCLPEEEAYVHQIAAGVDPDSLPPAPARVVAGKPEGETLYVDRQGIRVHLRGETLELREDDELVARQPLNVLDSVVISGMAQLTGAAISALLSRGIDVSFLGLGGRFKGALVGAASKNGVLRMHQAQVAGSPERRLPFAQAIVRGKIRNQRTLLQRAARRRAAERLARPLKRLEELAEQAQQATSVSTLMGIEGTAARLYFAGFAQILGGPKADAELRFDRRTRRPPRDPVNALMSFAYALLTSDITAAIHAAGLDPYVGLYHGQRYGQPALGLDLVEEMRPVIADSLVLRLVNNGEITRRDFLIGPTSVTLTDSARKTVISTYAERKNAEVKHPTFGYSIVWRRVFEVQARLLAKAIMGETPCYVPFIIR